MSWAPSFFAAAVAPARILTKNGFVTSFVISPTLTVAALRDVLADATVATVALAPTTSRATAASAIRLLALLAIGISVPPDPDCGIGAACSRSCGWPDDRASRALAQPLATNLPKTRMLETVKGLCYQSSVPASA